MKSSQKKYKKAYDRAEFYKDLFAHDMNNLLQNIRTSVELFQLWENSPEKREDKKNLLEMIEDQIDRGVNLISNVRKLSIIDQEEVQLREVDLESVLVKSINYITKRVSQKDINIKLSPISSDFKVLGGDLLLDAFKNIIYNGIIHNEQDTKEVKIKVSKSQNENWIQIEFRDNGIGIEDKLKNLIFMRDDRKDKSKGGLGIGLSLVKKIINTYKGKIWVENRVKEDHTQGSNFIILLKKYD